MEGKRGIVKLSGLLVFLMMFVILAGCATTTTSFMILFGKEGSSSRLATVGDSVYARFADSHPDSSYEEAVPTSSDSDYVYYKVTNKDTKTIVNGFVTDNVYSWVPDHINTVAPDLGSSVTINEYDGDWGKPTIPAETVALKEVAYIDDTHKEVNVTLAVYGEDRKPVNGRTEVYIANADPDTNPVYSFKDGDGIYQEAMSSSTASASGEVTFTIEKSEPQSMVSLDEISIDQFVIYSGLKPLEGVSSIDPGDNGGSTGDNGGSTGDNGGGTGDNGGDTGDNGGGSDDGNQGDVSNNAGLSGLLVSQGTLSPAFEAGNTSYSVSVPYSVSSLQFTLTKAEAAQTITVTGADELSSEDGVTTYGAGLSVGTNTISFTVTAEDGSTHETYAVTVTRSKKSKDHDNTSSTSGGNSSETTTPESPSGQPASSTVKINGSDVEATVTETTNSQGASVTHVRLDADKLLNAFSESAGITIDLDSSDPVVHVELPAKALLQAAGNQPDAFVLVHLKGVSYNLPVHALQNLPEDAEVALNITQVTGQAADDVNAAIEQAGGEQLLANPYDFTINVNGQEIADFNGVYVNRTLSTEFALDPNKVTAVWIDADNKVHFIPALISNNNGSSEVTIRSPHNSVYTVIESSKSFTDMNGHWGQKDVELLASKLIANGVTDSTFAPDATITRAEFAALLVRSLGLVENSSAAVFHDVQASDWFAGAAGAAQQAGLVTGYEDGTFRPDASITREQMVTMIIRALQIGDKEVKADTQLLAKFSDRADIADWAQAAASQALEANLIQGLTDTNFAAKESATRAQAASVVKRMLQYMQFIN